MRDARFALLDAVFSICLPSSVPEAAAWTAGGICRATMHVPREDDFGCVWLAAWRALKVLTSVVTREDAVL